MPSLEAYEAEAVSLAADAPRLGALRARIAENRRHAPLFDTARFARDLERAYRAMRERNSTGGDAAPIVIAPEAADE